MQWFEDGELLEVSNEVIVAEVDMMKIEHSKYEEVSCEGGEEPLLRDEIKKIEE